MNEYQQIKYDNFISLGYFCGVAQDLEKLGLRNTSSPFDWCLTSFEGVIRLIDNEFSGFMDYKNLAQNTNQRTQYVDTQYGVCFVHEFSKYKTLDEQFESVKEKYLRRIDRFKGNIKKPTLFVRYISDQSKNENDKSTELQWIEDNNDYINQVLQMYNPQNRIIYIGNEKMHSDIVKIYNVKSDKNDIVSRSPIFNNEELYPIMKQFEVPGQKENIRRFKKKYRKKRSLYARAKKTIVPMYCNLFFKVYIHSKEI
jgi:hypothetical protein